VKWIGVALMVVMFVLITIFSFFKWKQIQRGEMASTTGRIIGKVVLASFCAAVMGGAIIGGARYAQGPLGTWLNGPAWQVQPVYVVALLVAMIVWSIVLLVGRR